ETPALSFTSPPRRIPSREITLAIDGQQWPIKIEMNNFHSTLHLSKAGRPHEWLEFSRQLKSS
ncbi:hypothetical protein, partial [Bacillus cereus group sp. Bce018]|uniref:hypothetical protein n=1 Tax=Bacillus cereus group sp. Bce018 TaxID=3445248 RepID=UPI003F28CDCB